MKQPTTTTKLPSASDALKARPAARPANPKANEAFDKEVDEELQREWFQQIWDRYSGYILAAAIAVVVAVGSFKFMESRRIAAADAESVRYSASIKQLTEGKVEAGTQDLAALAKGSTGFATLSRFRLAAADAATGKTAEAIARYEALWRERGLDPILADFARLQTAMLQLDTASWGDMQSKLADLVSDNNSWRHNARELLGMAAMKANKRDEAKAQFEKLIGDPAVPAGMAERARIVMGSLAAADLAEKTPVAPPAPQPAVAAPTPAPAPTAPAASAPPSGAPAKKK